MTVSGRYNIGGIRGAICIMHHDVICTMRHVVDIVMHHVAGGQQIITSSKNSLAGRFVNRNVRQAIDRVLNRVIWWAREAALYMTSIEWLMAVGVKAPIDVSMILSFNNEN